MTSSDQTCTGCTGGFYLNTGVCTLCTVIPGCAVYSAVCTGSTDQAPCMTCSAGTFLNAGTGACTACTTFAGCIDYGLTLCDGTTAADQTCASCDSGYYLGASACTVCMVVPGCATYSTPCDGTTSADQACMACEPGFYIGAGPSCVQCTTIDGCTTYTASCATGATIADQTCSACIAGYIPTGAGTACTQCQVVTGCNSYTTACPVGPGGILPCLGCTLSYTFNAGTGACDPIIQSLLIDTAVAPCAGGAVQFQALIVYKDGSTLDVSADPLTAWSINNGCAISTTGQVTAGCCSACVSACNDVTIGANYNTGVATGSVDFTFPMSIG